MQIVIMILATSSAARDAAYIAYRALCNRKSVLDSLPLINGLVLSVRVSCV